MGQNGIAPEKALAVVTKDSPIETLKKPPSFLATIGDLDYVVESLFDVLNP